MVGAKHATSMSNRGVERLQQVLTKDTVLDSATRVHEKASIPKQKPRGRPMAKMVAQPPEHRRLMANRAHKWLDTHYPVSAFKDGKKMEYQGVRDVPAC
jgi:hypothetical protein